MLHSIDLLSCTVNFTLSVSISVFVMLRGMLLFISLLDICINCSKIRCKVKFFYHLCRCEWSSREREVFVIQSLTLCQLQSDRLMSLLDISGAFIGHTPFFTLVNNNNNNKNTLFYFKYICLFNSTLQIY